MQPPNEPQIIPFPKEDQPAPTQVAGLIATSLVCVCHCSDGKLRAIQFEGKQAKKIYGYVEHIQGGRVKMMKEPLLLVNDTAVVRQAIEEAAKPPSSHAGALAFLKSIFQRNAAKPA